jgi:hypothetical protein
MISDRSSSKSFVASSTLSYNEILDRITERLKENDNNNIKSHHTLPHKTTQAYYRLPVDNEALNYVFFTPVNTLKQRGLREIEVFFDFDQVIVVKPARNYKAEEQNVIKTQSKNQLIKDDIFRLNAVIQCQFADMLNTIRQEQQNLKKN